MFLMLSIFCHDTLKKTLSKAKPDWKIELLGLSNCKWASIKLTPWSYKRLSFILHLSLPFGNANLLYTKTVRILPGGKHHQTPPNSFPLCFLAVAIFKCHCTTLPQLSLYVGSDFAFKNSAQKMRLKTVSIPCISIPTAASWLLNWELNQSLSDINSGCFKFSCLSSAYMDSWVSWDRGMWQPWAELQQFSAPSKTRTGGIHQSWLCWFTTISHGLGCMTNN